MVSKEYQRFLDSMNISFHQWHEGEGYALDALQKLSKEERQSAEALLIERNNKDWRDVAALDVIGSRQAIDFIKLGLTSSNIEVRIESARRLKVRHLFNDAEMDSIIVDILRNLRSDFDFVMIMDLAQEYPTSTVKRMLLWTTVYGQDVTRFVAAELICFLYGLSPSRHDPNWRHFCGRFSSKDLSERKEAFTELCNWIGVDPLPILSDTPTPLKRPIEKDGRLLQQRLRFKLTPIRVVIVFLMIVLLGSLIFLWIVGSPH